MFTGIISGMGRIEAIDATPETDSVILRILAPNHTENLDLGGSIAINGVCLTATSIAGDTLSLDVMGETLRHTTIGALEVGEAINLERCVKAGGRLDGHVVQGHVDGVGELIEHESLGAWDRFRFAIPFELAKYVAKKGSIAIDGISLTVTEVSPASTKDQWFEVGIIPTTLRETTLGQRVLGSAVNLEVDVMAKYAERLVSFTSTESSAS
ncbi:riboflavin synthase [Paeniglutamicibacter gangotriensis]|uniref:Riboflavin synthase n=2 Tax=Paeniglutamicibacter gangotriensis TaxID=254787 RepID=M7NEQ2_9MICC|nr:riboflavin synthase [Paeniglutamicibacter gangotriensis]EMQ96993.1 riboflavin synthase subunit alpha [Paeniglutamicibacter gangotriensis Lz1y]KAA0979783.1 riboflavin synthase [Paeniglutamicibacter gangotriensis]